MSALNSCSSWKDLKKPQNPFFGAMFSRSHRKRKRKRVLQPIDNPTERGRSLENHREMSEKCGIRSISVENAAVLKAKHENLKELLLDPSSQIIVSTESSLEIKLPPKPMKNKAKGVKVAEIKPVAPEQPPDSLYADIDKAIMNNTISIRKKYVKPLHPDDPKPVQSFRRGRKYVKSPVKNEHLPYAPDLKPVSINAFNLQISRLEVEVSQFYDSVSQNNYTQIEDLLKNISCKLCLN